MGSHENGATTATQARLRWRAKQWSKKGASRESHAPSKHVFGDVERLRGLRHPSSRHDLPVEIGSDLSLSPTLAGIDRTGQWHASGAAMVDDRHAAGTLTLGPSCGHCAGM